MYNKVATDMNFAAREKQTAQMWKDKDIIRKSFHHRDGNEQFTFFDGPPTANGKPHIGHIETRVIKDLIPRYQTMKGKSVLRAWTESPRSRNTASSPSSPTVKRACGNICTNGKR